MVGAAGSAGWAKDLLGDINDLEVLLDADGGTTLVVADDEGIALVRVQQIRRVYAGFEVLSVAFVDAQRGWAVGEDGTILASSDGGESWSAQASGTEAGLAGVHFVDAQRGWAVGEDGTILASSDGGVSWSTHASGSEAWLGAVHFVDAQRGWAVGSGGTILASSDGGASWSAQASGQEALLMGVHFVDAQRGWAVGLGGTILASSDGGASWSAQASGTEARLYAVHFLDAQRGWAVGSGGTILASSDGGASWSAQASGTEAVLAGVHFVDAQRGWAVGEDGTILASSDGGASWSAQASGSKAWLTRVHFVDAQRGWAVGRGGTILASSDGGASWQLQPSRTSAPLSGLSVLRDRRTLWAVGPYTMLKSNDGGATWISQSPMRVELPVGFYGLVGAAGVLLLVALAVSLVPQRSDRGGEVESDAAISTAQQDRLHAQQQAERLAAFFNHVGTNPPLTLAINGPWGSGKSSLMNLLSQELRLDGFRPVWINLWHQQDEAQLYTNLVKAIRADGIAPWWLSSGLLLRLSLAMRRAGPWILLAGATAAAVVYSLYPPRWQSESAWHQAWTAPWKYLASEASDTWDKGKARRILVGPLWLNGLSSFHGFDQRPSTQLLVDQRLADGSDKPVPVSSSSATQTSSSLQDLHEALVRAMLRPVWGRQFANLDELLVEVHRDSSCSARARPDSGLGRQLSCPEFHQAVDWLVRAHTCKSGMRACQEKEHQLTGWQSGLANLAHHSARLSVGPGHEWPAVIGLLLALLTIVPQFRVLPGDYRGWYAKLRSSFGAMPEGDPGLRHRFARGLSQLARHMQRRPLVIFFDDLDRLDGKRTLEFLECLNFLSTDHRAGYYIVGMDYERVVYTLAPVFADEVKAKHGEADAEALRQAQIRHARRYLHKLIHVVHTLHGASAAEVLAAPDARVPARASLRRWLHQRRGLLRRGFEVSGPLLLVAAIAALWWGALDQQTPAPRPTNLPALGPVASLVTVAATAPVSSGTDPIGASKDRQEYRSSGFSVPDRSFENLRVDRPAWLLAVIPMLLIGLLLVYRFSTRKLKDPVSLREAYHRWFQLLPIETPRDAKRLANAIRVEAGLSRELLLGENDKDAEEQIKQSIELVAQSALASVQQRLGSRRFRWGNKFNEAADKTGLNLDAILQSMSQVERKRAIERVLRYSGLGS